MRVDGWVVFILMSLIGSKEKRVWWVYVRGLGYLTE